MKTLAVLTREGFTSTIIEDDDGRVHFTADADIDADGANGQNGAKAAYMVGDAGLEALANGGMKMQSGRVVEREPWFRDIVLLDAHGDPREFAGGVIASKTSYRWFGKAADDPAAYVDSATVRYIVVPPVVIQKTAGAVLGCRCRVTNLLNGRSAEGIVADAGPTTKDGELSIAMAEAVGIPSSPRSGGMDTAHVLYEVWPGQSASGFATAPRLMRSNGQYV